MEKILTNVMNIGEQMLISGAEVHRVEDSVRRMCCALGAKRIDIFIITSSMVATVYTQEGEIFTQTRRITAMGTDLEKIHRLNDLSRKICEGKVPPTEIEGKLQQALDCKSYPFWLECISYAGIAGAFTLFFGGGWIEMLVSLLVGAIVRYVILFAEKAIPNKIFSKFISAVTATSLAFLAVKIGWIGTVDKIIIGNIMTLIPGVGLTNALRDLFTGDSIAGLLRSIEAVLTALAIAAGYFLVVVLGGFAL